MELKNYPAPYVLRTLLRQWETACKPPGTGFTMRSRQSSGLCWRCWRPFQLRQHWASWRAVWEVRIKT